MGEKKFTLFELHLDGDTQLGPRTLSNVVGADDGDAEPTGVGTSPMDESEAEDGRSVVALFVGLMALVGLALAVKKVRGSDEESGAEEREVVVG